MDRSKISRLSESTTWRRDFFALFLLSLWLLSCAPFVSAQEEGITEGFGSEKKEPEPLNRTLTNSSGLYFGHVLFIQPKRYIFVRPTDSEYARKTFYLDSRSRYSKFVDGLRKRARSEELVEGQKVAVRYFSGESFAVADEVFLVNGEFEPSKYGKSKRRSRRKKAAPKKKEAESSSDKDSDEDAAEDAEDS